MLGPTLNRIPLENSGLRSKRHWLLALMDRLGAAIATHAPCKPGCDACCHIPVFIYEHEAQALGVLTRRIPKKLPRRSIQAAVEAGKQLSGQTYPFLEPDPVRGISVCSVYDIRPFACRQCHSLGRTSEGCGPSNGDVASLDAGRYVEQAYIRCLEPGASFGDIREFFPE